MTRRPALLRHSVLLRRSVLVRHSALLRHSVLAVVLAASLLLPAVPPPADAVGVPLAWEQGELAWGTIGDGRTEYGTYVSVGSWRALANSSHAFGFDLLIESSVGPTGTHAYLLAQPFEVTTEGLLALRYISAFTSSAGGLPQYSVGYLFVYPTPFDPTTRLVALVRADSATLDESTGAWSVQLEEATTSFWVYHCRQARVVNPLGTGCDEYTGDVQSAEWPPRPATSSESADGETQEVPGTVPPDAALPGEPPPPDQSISWGESPFNPAMPLVPAPEPSLPLVDDPPLDGPPPAWPVQYFLRGHVSLNQEDAGCLFSATPYSSGTIDIDLNQTLGTVSGTLEGSGAGVRNLTCEGQTGTMTWWAEYAARFSGPYDPESGAVSMTGELIGTTTIGWQSCTSDGTTPMECPSGGALSYVHLITLDGAIESMTLTDSLVTDAPTTHRGSGTWVVEQGTLPTFGAWAVGPPPSETPPPPA